MLAAMILQFGTGNFLRAFADLFVEELDQCGAEHPGPVIAVQSTGHERAGALRSAGCRYHVAVQGFHKGVLVDETIAVRSIAEALTTNDDWERILGVARHATLRAMLSNTTEAGLALDERDQVPPASGIAPHSFPAKLLACLHARFETGLSGCWIVPCELVESNGQVLHRLAREQAQRWRMSDSFLSWLQNDCLWPNTLVDRIVPGPPKRHPLLGQDPLLLSCEPFAFWAVETDRGDFPFAAHPAVTCTADISPYSLRKIRLLNGAHTALVAKALNQGFQTVGDCLNDSALRDWLERLLFEEVVPTLEGRCEDPIGFAHTVLDRFRNPFLEHALTSIALHHPTKIRTRLLPTLANYRERFDRDPPLLSALLG